MKDKKKSKLSPKEKPYKLKIAWILAIFLIILILSFFYVGYVKDLIYQNVYQNIKELSEQTATQDRKSVV